LIVEPYLSGRPHPSLETPGEASLRLRRGPLRSPEDECADALASLDETGPFQVPVCLEDSVRIDRHLGDYLFHRGQLVSWPEDAHAKGLFDLLDDLKVGRYTRGRAELEAQALVQEFSSHIDNYMSIDQCLVKEQAQKVPDFG